MTVMTIAQFKKIIEQMAYDRMSLVEFSDYLSHKKKHDKEYQDTRSLVVVFSGDYSGEDDAVIHHWMSLVRRQITRGTFKEILLAGLDRRRVFTLFPPTETRGGS